MRRGVVAAAKDRDPGVTTVETAWIPLADGRRLAARLFLPKDAAANPVPAILEYIPYRRRDGTRLGDDEMHLWFAAHGYACARVDIAGTGDSDGLVEDEYVEREQDDALEVIAWLAGQAWCSGAVGMIGISWGGFNGLQVAARRPPALKAIVTMCSTDDRYACDAHYLGGCLLNDNFSWGGAFFNYAALPPDPAVVGEGRWRDMWRRRIEALQVFPGEWLKHQRRDEFWKQGSICEDFAAIACPVLAVGGWLDGYTPTVFRLVENLEATCKGLVGPWGHKEPQRGVPGPAIGFLQECKRWWDRWLKDQDTGVERAPAMRLWLMEHAAPVPHFLERPGRWLGLPQWPSKAIRNISFFPSDQGLTSRRAKRKSSPRAVCSPQTVGLHAQEWCPYGQGRIAPEGAIDQREDDGGSICFDTAPLAADLHLIGAARIRIRVKANQPQALVAIRLTDVAPDGTSAFVTLGVLNLAHRRSHEHPAPLKPGQYYAVDVTMKPVAQTFPRGHRLRMAISSTYWPMVWPSPRPVTLTIDPDGSRVDLPVLATGTGLARVKFEPAEHAQHGPLTVKEPPREAREITYDGGTQETVYRIVSDDGRFVLDEIGTEITSRRDKTYAISRSNPAACRSTVGCHQEYRRKDWNARVDSEVSITCDSDAFYVQAWVKAYDRGEIFAERTYQETIARDCI